MDFDRIISTTFKPEVAMYSEETVKDLTELFRETGPAHHKAFIETDGFDLEWPLWYADFMLERVMDMLDVEITKAELIFLLVGADLEHRDEAPDADWPPFYSTFFVESLG